MAHVWALETPQRLRRAGVEAHYDRATFVRETALADSERPPALAYLALGHPLLDGLIAAVKTDAREGGTLAGRMSVRVLRGALPGFLFTYLGRWQDGRGAVAAEEIVPIFVGLDGASLPSHRAADLLAAVGLPRNTPSDLLAKRYEQRWSAAREQALALAATRCAELAERVRAERITQLAILQRDVEVWAEARLAWVERQLVRRAEQEAIALPLFLEEREQVLATQRARAAAETRRKNELQREREVIANRRREREAEIARMGQISLIAPELIGALVIVPEEEL